MAYVGNNLTIQQYAPQIAYFNGTGSATAFTLPTAVVSAAQIIVVIENVIQNPSSSYSVSGTTLTFTSAPPSGTSNIWVEYTSLETNTIAPSPGTVGLSQLSASGTPSAATFLRGDNTWAAAGGFTAGTLMLFQQTAAPTGWTKQVTHDNKALRLVSGSAGTGGSVAFTTAFAAGLNAGATTLDTSQIPSHTHTVSGTYQSYGSPNISAVYTLISSSSTGAAGGGGSHTHTLPSFAVSYVDIIIASKD